jgi:hypothetical protein
VNDSDGGAVGATFPFVRTFERDNLLRITRGRHTRDDSDLGNSDDRLIGRWHSPESNRPTGNRRVCAGCIVGARLQVLKPGAAGRMGIKVKGVPVEAAIAGQPNGSSIAACGRGVVAGKQTQRWSFSARWPKHPLWQQTGHRPQDRPKSRA